MPSEFDRVSIFIGGVQKGGTTSLHSYFAEHPRLLAPRQKETHFFDDERSVDWDCPDYQGQFHDRFYLQSKPDALAYDATPITIFWRPSVERILAYNQNAKFIFLFRDPIERAFSHWSMEFGRGAETLAFSSAIREGRERLSGLPKLHPDRRVFTYVERGFYARQLDRILMLVAPEQILFLSSAELAAQPAICLSRVEHFLGIQPFPCVKSRRVFAGRGCSNERLSERDIDYLRTIFHEDSVRFSAMTGIDISDWLVTNLSK